MNDVQIVEFPQEPVSLWKELERYISARRKQLQDWEANPPHWVGAIVFVVVVIELVLGFSIINNAGLNLGIFRQMGSFALGLIFVEFLFVRSAHEAGALFNKKGRKRTAWTFINLGLLPLLLFLPMVALCQLSPHMAKAPTVLLILLIFQVLANWREAVEVSFELSRLQSAILMYVVGGFAMMILGLVLYIGFLSTVLDVLNSF